VADSYLVKGVQRLAQAREANPPDTRLEAFALEYLQVADEHTTIASQQLKELISRSPGYINHGRLEARINLIRAETAATRGDQQAKDAFVRNAAAAIERELRRQPFDPHLAIEYARIAGATGAGEDLLTALARPLRHNRVEDAYVDLLEQLVQQPSFDQLFRTVSEQLRGELSANPKAAAEKNPADWGPEKLRLAATVSFLRGEFEAAATNLAPACQAYEAMRDQAPLGTSACFAEWADALFFSRPDQSQAALQSAEKALAYAPQSEAGRQLQDLVRQRMIHYLLASGNDEGALAILVPFAPAGVSAGQLTDELAARARRMIESVVRTRRHWLISTEDGKAMLESLDSQFARIGPRLREDVATRVLASQLAILKKDVDRLAENLRRALELGLEPAAAQSLLEAGKQAGLESPALTILQQAIDEAMKTAEPAAGEEITPTPATADESTRNR
jgi:hypothetical protein